MLGAMPADAGGAAAGADEGTLRALSENERAGPWATADSMGFDEIIDPRELRNALLRALSLADGRGDAELGPVARRGILP
jgi:acetyl-CoA carboxylase carboxyltransferase component